MIGVLFIVVVLIIVPDHHRSIGYVFGQTINNTGLRRRNDVGRSSSSTSSSRVS